jgi:hypothetical protein
MSYQQKVAEKNQHFFPEVWLERDMDTFLTIWPGANNCQKLNPRTLDYPQDLQKP